MKPTRIVLAVAAASAVCMASAEPLKRRADTGIGVAPPVDGKPARVTRVREGSALGAAGMQQGDEIVAIDGAAVGDETAFLARWRKLRGDDTPRFTARRGGRTLEFRATLPKLREETIQGVDVRYGEAPSEQGYRVRTYTTRPAGEQGRLPLVVFVPWLSCGPVENPVSIDGWGKMLRAVMRDAGVQMVRIEKPGVGDSEGPDCSQTDLDHDMAAFRAGIRAALADAGADRDRLYLFGGSIGGALVPFLAQEFRPRGIIATGGFTRTWYEHMLDIERRRLTLSGEPPAKVNEAMRAFAPFYERVLVRGMTPAEAIVENPAWKAIWYDAPAHQYGRPIRYYQQLQQLDVEGAWQKVNVPTLIVWGDHDWIMGREESDRAAEIVRARNAALLTYVVRRGMDHHFDVYADPASAFREEGGRYDEGAALAIVEWLRAQRAAGR